MMAPIADELLDLPPDSGWRAMLQPAGARLHPGKLHLGFLAYLLDRYTKPGDVLLDPMAGVGSLLLTTTAHWGCHVVLNELEGQWADWAAATYRHMQQAPRWDYRPVGDAAVLCGDARTLRERLAGAADCVVTSPPYGDALSSIRHSNDADREFSHGRPGSEASKIALRAGYDTVITSPPYGDALGQGKIGKGLQEFLNGERGHGPASLMRLEHRYDAVVTSPPYADALSPQRHSDDYHPERQAGHWRGQEGDGHVCNIRRGYDPAARGKRASNPAQIGNLSGKRYASAMAEVYVEVVDLLKPGGYMIVILKNIVRQNKEVDLVGQAGEQLSALGLVPVTTHWRRVALGAFHAIRRKANPDALIIDREAAIVFRKPNCEVPA